MREGRTINPNKSTIYSGTDSEGRVGECAETHSDIRLEHCHPSLRSIMSPIYPVAHRPRIPSGDNPDRLRDTAAHPPKEGFNGGNGSPPAVKCGRCRCGPFPTFPSQGEESGQRILAAFRAVLLSPEMAAVPTKPTTMFTISLNRFQSLLIIHPPPITDSDNTLSSIIVSSHCPRSLRRRKVAQDTRAGAWTGTSAGTPLLARRERGARPPMLPAMFHWRTGTLPKAVQQFPLRFEPFEKYRV